MSVSIHQLAIERCVDRLMHMGAQMIADAPPQGAMSDEQQVQVYLDVIANPQAVQAMILHKGKSVYNQWVAAMSEKARLLGMVNANLAPGLEPDERRDLMSGAWTEEE